jgi:beta-lactamase superfamily II metal-dependent hydrolase
LPWELEIHHLDVQSSGDCTLIVAREIVGGQPGSIRTALIDGGRQIAAGYVYDYLVSQLTKDGLIDVLVTTHYDNDHYNGLTQLLLRPLLFNNVRIYDQGWPETSDDNAYIAYLSAINGLNANGKRPVNLTDVAINRRRMTSAVYSGDAPPMLTGSVKALGPPAVPSAISQPPHWLLTAAAPADVLWDGVPGGRPAGAPSMQCVAVNKYIRTTGGGVGGPYGSPLTNDPRHEQSLAFLVTFGNFKYYLGGDIETAQEDQIQLYLNTTNDAVGRVVAVKASHHGANTATSRTFVNRLRPQAVFISCATANQFCHPDQETINILDGYPANPMGTSPVTAHAAPPPAPPLRPIDNYLTGYQAVGPPPKGYIGLRTAVAGDPNASPPHPGDLVLRVSATQSATDQRGRLYRGVLAAATGAASAAGVANAMTGPAADAAAVAAAEAVVSYGPGRAALAFLQSAGYPAVPAAVTVAITAKADAAWGGPAPAPTAASAATAVTAAAIADGVTNGPAAAAGAVIGAAIDGGEPTGVQAAVTAALMAAGLAPGPAGTAGTAASQALGGETLFDVTFYRREVANNVTEQQA